MYKSFEYENNKLRLIFNEVDKNKNNLANLTEKSVNFNTEVSYNITEKIPLETKLLANNPFVGSLFYEFNNLPEWVIDSFKIHHRFYLSEEHQEFTIKYGTVPFGQANIGDIILPSNDKFDYFWIKEGEKHILNIHCFKTANLVSSVNLNTGGFSTTSIPIFVDISILPINKREYNELSIRKRQT